MLYRLMDAFGQPVYLSLVEEASARGAALLALEASGLIQDTGEISMPLGKVCLPDAERQLQFKRLIASQQSLYQNVIKPPPI